MYCLLENGVNVRKSSIVTIIEPHQFSEGWNNGCLSPRSWFDLEKMCVADRTLVRKHDDGDFIDRLYNGYHCKVILSRGTYCD